MCNLCAVCYLCEHKAQESLFDIGLFVQFEHTEDVHPMQRAGIDKHTELDIIFHAQGRNIFVTEI